MGFYQSDKAECHQRQTGALRWISVVALSALVGSSVTLAIVRTSAFNPLSRQSTAVLSNDAADVSPVPTAVNVNVRDGITTAVKKVEPAVMGVVNYAQVSDFLTQQTKLQATGVGTGVLFYKDTKYGFAVTNNHVVADAAKVQVVLESGKHVQAQVVGTDPYTDLAVLRVPIAAVKNIIPAAFANSDDIEVGEPAIAIGTPMGLDFADSVTAGIVSAKKRIMPVQQEQTQQILDYQTVIQTDAAINPGNSGGPLLNINGKVIGINSSKIVAPNFEGMGFAIPSNEARNIADQIMKSGHALHPALGISGVSLAALPEEWWPDVPVDYGVWIRSVTSVETKSSGLKPQDVIVGIDNHSVKTMADLRTYLFQDRPGQVVTLRIYRANQQINLKVKLGQMASDAMAPVNPDQEGAQADPSDPFASPGWGN